MEIHEIPRIGDKKPKKQREEHLMRTNHLKSLLLFLMLTKVIFAGSSDPDLILQSEITPQYIVYLAEKEATWLLQVAIGGDNTAAMKAHMGLAILAFAWSHVDGDTFTTDIDPVFEDIIENFDGLGDQFDLHIQPLFQESTGIGGFVEQLTDFFESGDYVSFRDSVENYLEKVDENLNEARNILEDWFANLEDNFSEDHFEDHLNAIADGTAGFEFSFQVVGSEYADDLFVFSRTFFNRIDTLDDLGREMNENFENGADWMDSVMAETDGDVLPGIAYFRVGLSKMTSYIDTTKTLYTSDPFTPFAIDVSPLDSLREAILEVDTLLGGKEYEIGPDEEGKTIKPLALIQNLPGNGVWRLYKDFYRSSNPSSYTFGGIFPNGLTTDILDFIEADAVLNELEDEDTLYSRLMDLKEAWLEDIDADPDDPDAHMGVALVLIYEMVRDHEETFADVFRLLDKGRIDSLTYHYDWDDVDLSDEISEIGEHVDFYVDADDPKHLNILIKTESDSYGQYEIGPESQFEVVHISVSGTRIARGLLSMAGEALTVISSGLISIFDEISEIFIVDLDPSVLDFSQVDSDRDLILMLEESNPAFLFLTPYGVEQFQSAGDQLEEGFEELGNFFDQMTDLAHALAPYDEDFHIEGDLLIEDMESARDVAWEIWEDFAYPDSVTMVDDERVNFSAWFDYPPESFLIMWKKYVFGTDRTLGGLFPDRSVNIEPGILVFLPKGFVLHPNYPNPFNPVTTLRYDLPERSDVVLIVYDIMGRQVKTLIRGAEEPGYKSVIWDGTDELGIPVGTGVYLYQIRAGSFTQTRKMLLLR